MISIIIIVKNDRGINNTLENLDKLTSTYDKEIIVVDASGGKLNDIKSKYKYVKWINYNNIGNKKITIPEQRNEGLRHASGDIMTFIDANCIPQSDWLDELIKPILEEHESIVSGATLSLNGITIHDQLADKNKNVRYLDECATINLAVQINVFEKVGKFDESFDYGSDVDFTWRARETGYKIRYAPLAIIRHDWGKISQEIKRSYLYGRARARLYRKHKNKVQNLFTKDVIVIVYSLFILLLPLTIIFPYYPLLLVLLLIKNYNKDPFHVVFDHLIYACGALREILLPT